MYTLSTKVGYNNGMSTNIYSLPNQAFSPHRFVRSADIQTLLSRYRPRYLAQVKAYEYPMLIDAGRPAWNLVTPCVCTVITPLACGNLVVVGWFWCCMAGKVVAIRSII
jgi:hypothetical protein